MDPDNLSVPDMLHLMDVRERLAAAVDEVAARLDAVPLPPALAVWMFDVGWTGDVHATCIHLQTVDLAAPRAPFAVPQTPGRLACAECLPDLLAPQGECQVCGGECAGEFDVYKAVSPLLVVAWLCPTCSTFPTN